MSESDGTAPDSARSRTRASGDSQRVPPTWPQGGKGIPIPPLRHHRKRFDFAVDRILNSGTMYGHIDAFWRFIDGDNDALEEFPS